MRDHLLIYVNGRALRVTGDDAFLTLAEFLRRRRRLTGTKVVCAEGDCGACAVLIGRVSPDEGSIQYASVNSCIQMMFQLDATHLVTVEGLKYRNELNPIQKRDGELPRNPMRILHARIRREPLRSDAEKRACGGSRCSAAACGESLPVYGIRFDRAGGDAGGPFRDEIA